MRNKEILSSAPSAVFLSAGNKTVMLYSAGADYRTNTLLDSSRTLEALKHFRKRGLWMFGRFPQFLCSTDHNPISSRNDQYQLLYLYFNTCFIFALFICFLIHIYAQFNL